MRGRICATVFAAAVAFAALTPSSWAHQVSVYHYDTSFDGAGSSGGKFTNGIHDVAVNDANGNLYVSDQQAPACPGSFSSPQTITQLDESGQPKKFPDAEEVSTLCVENAFIFGETSVLFDNTGHGDGLFAGIDELFNFSPTGALNPDYPVFSGVSPISESATAINYDMDISPENNLWVINSTGLRKRDPATGANLGGKTTFWPNAYPNGGQPRRVKIDSNGYMYFSNGNVGPGVKKFAPESQLTFDTTKLTESTPQLAEFGPRTVRDMAIDRSNNHIYVLESCCEEYLGNEVTEYTSEGAKIQSFGLPEGPYPGLEEAEGIAVNSNTHTVYVARRGANPGVDVLKQGPALTVPDTATLGSEPAATSAVLNGTVNPDGIETTECRFEWGTTLAYNGGVSPCSEGNSFTGSSDTAVSASLTGLNTGQTYHYRVSAKNSNGVYSYGVDHSFEAAAAPVIKPPVQVREVNTDGSILEAEIDPRGGKTSYWVEYGPGDCATSTCSRYPIEDLKLESNLGSQEASVHVEGLTPDTEYHFRLVAQNGTGTAYTPDQTFKTFPTNPGADQCPNVQVRQQTGASLLMDCRAYELVSARNAGGYDVESNVVPGQEPLPSFPQAKNSLLYSLHFGLIPGIEGSPTNYGRDPYVATRGADGWSTRYVGLPATAGGGNSEPFGSPLAGASEDLSTFAFSGPHLCSPCFDDGSSGIPVRLPDGRLVQGMAGSIDPGPGATQAGFVREPLSADGAHLVFGSTAQFEPDANNNGDVTIYERDLATETTEVVSKTTAGATMSGTDIGEVAISDDGSRVVLARKVGLPDAAGNQGYHLYMKVAGSSGTVDLTPGTTTGVFFAGMTANGGKVFFTTKDPLLGDTDTSVDLYEAAVDSAGSLELERLSTGQGGTGNTDACSPPGEPRSWNAVSGTEGKCNVVAFADGSGVAHEDGTIYFLSPEKLDGASNGEQDQANLYVVRPGSAPKFVATMDSSSGKPGPPPPAHPLENGSFITGLNTPESIAVDQTNGDVYVSERGAGRVSRFTSAGAPEPFSALGSNQITGQNLGGPGESQIAVDSAASSPFKGSLYVTTNGSAVKIYANSGEQLGELSGFGEACGVSVDQSNGTVYVGSYPNTVYKFVPISSGAPGTVTNANYEAEKRISLTDVSVCNVDADPTGHVYAKSYYFGGNIKQYEASEFAASPPSLPGKATGSGNSMQSDPTNSDLYIDEGTKVSQFTSSGELVQSFGAGQIESSRGVAVDGTNGVVYATSGEDIVKFGSEARPYEPIDNPAIEHGVRRTAVHDSADFQVTPDGRFAAFGSTLPLTGYPNRGHSEIYRYDTGSGGTGLQCVSCARTNAVSTSDAFLTSGALNLIPDGRVFFDSREALVLRDRNSLQDVYEWANGKTELISTGTGTSDVGLLSASSDGVDVFFFTRETLAAGDENGNSMKVYDAREGGGFLFIPGLHACAASDECHGPGTPVPAPPAINTVTGQGVHRTKAKSRHKKHHHRKHRHKHHRKVRHG